MKCRPCLSLALLLLGTPALLVANSYTFQTPTGSSDSAGDAVNAKAVFTTGTNSVTIDLYNLLTAGQMKDAGQLLSDVFFSMNNTLTSGSVSSSSASFLQVSSDKSSATAPTPAGSDPIGWGLSYDNSKSAFHLDGLNGTSTPAHQIIGGAAGDTYTSSNPSINKTTGPHNPFVAGTGHFVLTIAGVTASTSITGMKFSFGTTTGDNVTGTLTPEPGYLLTLLLMFGGLIVSYRKKRRTA